jgi:hypothetical protein
MDVRIANNEIKNGVLLLNSIAKISNKSENTAAKIKTPFCCSNNGKTNAAKNKIE